MKLFRYTKRKHYNNYCKGIISFRDANLYKNEEGLRNFKEGSTISNVEETIEINGFSYKITEFTQNSLVDKRKQRFQLSFSTVYNKELISNYNGIEGCIEINNFELFYNKLRYEIKKIIPDVDIIIGPVQYYDSKNKEYMCKRIQELDKLYKKNRDTNDMHCLNDSKQRILIGEYFYHPEQYNGKNHSIQNEYKIFILNNSFDCIDTDKNGFVHFQIDDISDIINYIE